VAQFKPPQLNVPEDSISGKGCVLILPYVQLQVIANLLQAAASVTVNPATPLPLPHLSGAKWRPVTTPLQVLQMSQALTMQL
jgi:hypothetical protein